MSEAIGGYRDVLRRLIGGRPLVLTGGAVLAVLVVAARELGSPKVFVLSTSADQLGADGSATFASPDWRDSLDSFDPAGEALVLGNNFHARSEFAGRRFVGARQQRWARFEDKTHVGALLAAAGVDQAPTVVVGASRPVLESAAARLDAGDGTVWAGDHRDGEHNSGRHIRWVNNPEQAAAAAEYFQACCDHVRVMPFLDGQPVGMHGFVAGGGVAVLRPVALDIHHDRRAGRFSYQGCRVHWAVSDELVAEVQQVAERVGTELGASVGYRGSFCIDGILTPNGFRPTELNARWGASLTVLGEAIPEVPLRFVHAFMADGGRQDWQPASLQRLILSRLSNHEPPSIAPPLGK